MADNKKQNVALMKKYNGEWSDGGPGSGLNADMVDGIQGSQLVRNDIDNTVNANLNFTKNVAIHGSLNLPELQLNLPDTNTDSLVIRRRDDAPDKTTLEIQIGDNTGGDDKLEIGTAPGGDWKWLHRFYNNGDYKLTGNVYASNGTKQLSYNDLSNVSNDIVLDKVKQVDGSGSGLDADTVDGIQGSQLVRADVESFVCTGTYELKADNQFKLSLYNTKNHPHSEIHFNSYINYGSDFGYIRYDDDNNTYNKWGDSDENSALVIGVQNDGQDPDSDVVALESPAGIFLNAPAAYVGDKNGGLIWHSHNDGPGSGLDADMVDGKHANQLEVPVGTVIACASDKVPDGFLECNGAAVSRSTYSALFNVIGTTYGSGDGKTTFNLPDLRGEFIRGWDHGRGVDPNRGIGTNQGDAARNIKATAGVKDDGMKEHLSGPFYDAGGFSYDAQSHGSGNGWILGFDLSRIGSSYPVANENRPRNVAVMFCIKY